MNPMSGYEIGDIIEFCSNVYIIIGLSGNYDRYELINLTVNHRTYSSVERVNNKCIKIA